MANPFAAAGDSICIDTLLTLRTDTATIAFMLNNENARIWHSRNLI
jgi:hypothetical protein